MKKLLVILNTSLVGLTSSLATRYFIEGNKTTAILWTIAAGCWFLSTIFNVLALKED